MPSRAPATVLAVYGPSGGTGRSLLTANLAVAIRQDTAEEVVVADFNRMWGVIEVILDLKAPRTTASLVHGLTQLDARTVEAALVRHGESGVRVLAAPSEPRGAGELTGHAVEILLPLLCEHYDWVLLDLATSLDDVTLAALERAETILFVSTLDLPVIRHSRRAIATLRQLGLGDRLELVLNRADAATGVSVAEATATLGLPLLGAIPSDGVTAVTSLNEGVPFVLGRRRTKLAAAVRELADRLTP